MAPRILAYNIPAPGIAHAAGVSLRPTGVPPDAGIPPAFGENMPAYGIYWLAPGFFCQEQALCLWGLYFRLSPVRFQ